MHSTTRLVQLAALGALAAMASGMQPAAAQYYDPGPRIYAPAPPPPPPDHLGVRNVDAAVRSLGLRQVSHARIHGPVLVVDAMGQEGSLVRVSIDRYSGRVTQIVRIGRAAPQVVTVPAQPEPYESDDEDDYAEYEPAPPQHGGPSVIMRQGGEPRDLSRAPAVTGSVTRDPLNGVPREFRGEQARPPSAPPQRLAARPPDPAPRATPLPRPRPADAPAVAQRDTPAQPAVKAAPTPPAQPPEAKQDLEKFPPVQGFE